MAARSPKPGELDRKGIISWSTISRFEATLQPREGCQERASKKGGTAGFKARPFRGTGLFVCLQPICKGVVIVMEIFATCTICECNIQIPEGTMEGEILLCPDCGTELEVLSLNPLRLEEAPEVEEDWGE